MFRSNGWLVVGFLIRLIKNDKDVGKLEIPTLGDLFNLLDPPFKSFVNKPFHSQSIFHSFILLTVFILIVLVKNQHLPVS